MGGKRSKERGSHQLFVSHTIILLVAKVTADGGINCADNPGEQEEISAKLLFCEVVISLLLLKSNGTLVLKTFTTLEHKTICLLYLLACCFAEVILVLPDHDLTTDTYSTYLFTPSPTPLPAFTTSSLWF